MSDGTSEDARAAATTEAQRVAEDLALFHASLDRVSASPAFLDLVYDAFLDRSPRAREIFRGVDMERLKRKLAAALRLVVLAIDDDPGASLYLEHIGRVHRRLDVGPELYPLWIDALVEAVGRCDPRPEPRTEAVWRELVGRAVQVILSQYGDADGVISSHPAP